jgi:hypothetical protein
MYKRPTRAKQSTTPVKKSTPKKRGRELDEHDQMFADLAQQIHSDEFLSRSKAPKFSISATAKSYKPPTRVKRSLLVRARDESGEAVADDTVVIIFSYLPLKSIINASMVCTDWNAIFNDHYKHILHDHRSLDVCVKTLPPKASEILLLFSNLTRLNFAKSNAPGILSHLLEQSPNLTYLDVTNCTSVPTDTVTTLSKLKGLCASSNVITNVREAQPHVMSQLQVLRVTGGKTFGFLPLCTQLVEFHASTQTFDDRALKTLVSKNFQTLRVLSIPSCTRILDLEGSLGDCIALEELDISMPLGYSNEWPLAGDIAHLPATIKKLNMFNNMCFSTLNNLTDAFLKCPFIGNLEELDLRLAIPASHKTRKEVYLHLKKMLHKTKALRRLIIDYGVYEKIETKDAKTNVKMTVWSNIEDSNDSICTLYK